MGFGRGTTGENDDLERLDSLPCRLRDWNNIYRR